MTGSNFSQQEVAMSTVAKQKPTRQIGFRLTEETATRLEALAARYGQDVSGFLRLMLAEQMPVYERRAEKMEQGEAEKEG